MSILHLHASLLIILLTNQDFFVDDDDDDDDVVVDDFVTEFVAIVKEERENFLGVAEEKKKW